MDKKYGYHSSIFSLSAPLPYCLVRSYHGHSYGCASLVVTRTFVTALVTLCKGDKVTSVRNTTKRNQAFLQHIYSIRIYFVNIEFITVSGLCTVPYQLYLLLSQQLFLSTFVAPMLSRHFVLQQEERLLQMQNHCIQLITHYRI